MHKEGQEQCFIYTIKYGCFFYLLRKLINTNTRRHTVNISFSKLSSAHWRGTSIVV